MIKKLLVTTLLSSVSLFSENWMSDTFIDPTDGQFDVSNWLLEKQGFLPTPIIITEPAVGYGGGLALSYFHEKLGNEEGVPPSVSAVFGGGTENGTWFGGAGHLGIWDDDNIRYMGGIGVGDIKMKYYGLPNIVSGQRNGIDFETKLFGTAHKLQFRIKDTNFFTSIGMTYSDTENLFKLQLPSYPDIIPEKEFDIQSVAVQTSLIYDSRDNLFSPSSGFSGEIEGMFFEDAIGSDDTFQRYSAKAIYYQPISNNFVLGIRTQGETVQGDAPFFSYPFIDMRGVKAMEFQGDSVVLGELELSWKINPRWSLIGFAGAGRTFQSSELYDTENVYSKGFGFRYLGAKKLGLQMGLDVAFGPEDTAFYLQVGSSWSLR